MNDNGPDVIESEGKSIDEAVRKALIETGWTRAEVRIEVIDPGSRSLYSNRLARVRLSRGADPLDLARQVTKDILDQMGLRGDVEADVEADHIRVQLSGEDIERRLIDNEGAGLDALQHLVSRIVSRRSGVRQMVTVDAGDYRRRRERELRDLAYRLADEVRETAGPITTEDFGAAERRVIHLALNEDPDITTYAIGEGLVKRIVIAPIDRAPAARRVVAGARAADMGAMGAGGARGHGFSGSAVGARSRDADERRPDERRPDERRPDERRPDERRPGPGGREDGREHHGGHARGRGRGGYGAPRGRGSRAPRRGRGGDRGPRQGSHPRGRERDDDGHRRRGAPANGEQRDGPPDRPDPDRPLRRSW